MMTSEISDAGDEQTTTGTKRCAYDGRDDTEAQLVAVNVFDFFNYNLGKIDIKVTW